MTLINVISLNRGTLAAQSTGIRCEALAYAGGEAHQRPASIT